MAKAKATPAKLIPENVLGVLRQMRWEKGIGYIDTQLPAKEYAQVKKVLEALGGKWDRKIGGQVFEGDGETLVRESIATGRYLDAKAAFEFFETPKNVAATLVSLADSNLLALRGLASNNANRKKLVQLRAEARVLEPSAGTGNLIAAMKACGYADFTAVETNHRTLKKLEDAHADIMAYQSDFLELSQPDLGRFDVVIMNPPFRNLADVRHVMFAAEFLKAPGVLVAVMCPAWEYRQDKIAQEFRDWLAKWDGAWTMLPDGSFSESGTGVRTGVLTLRQAQYKPRLFKVFSVSENRNSFGLTGHRMMDRFGDSWEAAKSTPLTNGEEILVPVSENGEPNFSRLGFEIPERMSNSPAPRKVIEQVWALPKPEKVEVTV